MTYKISRTEKKTWLKGMQIEKEKEWGKAKGTVLAMFAWRDKTQRDLIAFNYL